MKKGKKLRIVVDTNAWISSLLKPTFRVRLEVVFGTEYRLLCSEQSFHELENAVRKQCLAKRINRTNYETLVSLLKRNAEIVDVRSSVEICRDPKDNFLLALAKDGNADYLITGDDDLRVLKEFENTKIVSLSEFEDTVH
jgi:hypothetical protein